MSQQEIKIVKLDPMRVASFHGFGSEPETMAWDKLSAWAKKKGLEDGTFRIFGFNNPDPTPGSPNYGYEFWITIGENVESDGEAEIKQFPGGLYAVAHCEVKGDFEAIGRGWKAMITWLEDSPYKRASHQWMEEHPASLDFVPEEFVLELFAPIAA